MSAKLLGAAFEAKMGSHTRKLILLKLVDAAHDDGSRIFPAVESIAAAAECSAREVQRQLRKFQTAGLIACVSFEQGGRGKAREYLLRVEVLRELALVGFGELLNRAAAIEQGEESAVPSSAQKGDMVSPFSSGEKGDIHDLKGDSDDLKGDSRSHPTSYTPQDPLVHARPGAPDGSPGEPPRAPAAVVAEKPKEAGNKKPEPEPSPDDDPAFLKLVKDYPGVHVIGRCFPLWRKLDDQERRHAGARLPAYLADRHNRKRDLHALDTYLREKLFDQVSAAVAANAANVSLPNRSQEWWALFHRRLATPDWRDERTGRTHAELARNQIRMAIDHKVGSLLPLAEAPSEAELAALVKIERGKEAFRAWVVHLRPLQIDHHEVSGMWIWVPTEYPLGGAPG